MSAIPQPRTTAGKITRGLLLLVFAVFFALPLIAMLDFTTRLPNGTRTGAVWAQFIDLGDMNTNYPELIPGVITSLLLTITTVGIMLALLVPTMVWVRLRVPGVRKLVEFICLLPLTVPAIVLVVGLAPIYAWVTYFFGESAVLLCFAYVVLVLPYSYRALDSGLRAIDVTTLSEAARSLGASWFTVIIRVILPNLRSAVLSASFLAVAVVLGEFTIASLLSRNNIQTTINFIGKRDAQMAVAVSFAFLALAFILLFGLSFVGRSRRGGQVATGGLAPTITEDPS
ncbi:MAG: ABC transporter permease subunit [Dermatophilaceae bacterium]